MKPGTVQIDRNDAEVYYQALTNELMERGDKSDREVLNRLVNELAELPQDWGPEGDE